MLTHIMWCWSCLHMFMQFPLKHICAGRARTSLCVFAYLLVHWFAQFSMCVTFRCMLHRARNQHINPNIDCTDIQRRIAILWLNVSDITPRIVFVSSYDICQELCNDVEHIFANNNIHINTCWSGAVPRFVTVNIQLVMLVRISAKQYVYAHEWSFRRFTYGNLVTTSPSSKW